MGRDERIKGGGGPPRKPSMTEFARAVAEGVVGARDRFGNPIKRGHVVTYRAIEADPVFEVVDIAPILDPRQPNMVKVTLSTIIPLRVHINQATQVLMIVGDAPEKNAAMPAPPPASDQPPTGDAPGPRLVLTDAPDVLNEPPPLDEGDALPEPPEPTEDHDVHETGRPDTPYDEID